MENARSELIQHLDENGVNHDVYTNLVTACTEVHGLADESFRERYRSDCNRQGEAMLRMMMVWLCSFSSIVHAGQNREDRVYIEGTRENICAMAAKSEMTRLGYSYEQQSESPTDVWIYNKHFDFSSSGISQLRSVYTYRAKPDENKSNVDVQGIVQIYNESMNDLKARYPRVITTDLADHKSFSLTIECIPQFVSGEYRSSRDELLDKRKVNSKLSDRVVENLQLGVREYHDGLDFDFVSTSDIERNPDGSEFSGACDLGILRSCRSSFLLRSGVLVSYNYPIEQQGDWLSIRNFILFYVTNAIKER